jgi:class 3 adenylate cyclase
VRPTPPVQHPSPASQATASGSGQTQAFTTLKDVKAFLGSQQGGTRTSSPYAIGRAPLPQLQQQSDDGKSDQRSETETESRSSSNHHQRPQQPPAVATRPVLGRTPPPQAQLGMEGVKLPHSVSFDVQTETRTRSPSSPSVPETEKQQVLGTRLSAPQSQTSSLLTVPISPRSVNNRAVTPSAQDEVSNADGYSRNTPDPFAPQRMKQYHEMFSAPQHVAGLSHPTAPPFASEVNPEARKRARSIAPRMATLPPDSRAFLERFIELAEREGATLFGTLSMLVPRATENDYSVAEHSHYGSGTSGDSNTNEFLSVTKSSPLSPLVCHLTFNCLGNSGTGDHTEFDTWRGECAVLFIDLSGYSKVTSLIGATQGAQGISDVVNGYLTRILDIAVSAFHGDVVKFAGDAIVVVWSYPTAEQSCLVAAACAMEIQLLCGEHPVEGTDLFFRLHMGIAYGEMESEVLVPKQSVSMQRAFHFVTGQPIAEVGQIVDVAAPREVCVSARVVAEVGDQLSLEPTKVSGVHKLLEVLDFTRIDVDPPSFHRRLPSVESWFVHPLIAKRLHFGIKATHLAEMRHLCVLFIAKTGQTHVADWFHEMQEELDLHRCPIVQIIDDDKGVHVVAAVNLFVSEDNPSMLGIACARALITRGVECLVGIATGSTFCGIVGGSETAARWDITGEACVRACRLMQAATKLGVQVVVDKSVFEEASDVSQLQPIGSVSVKGTDQPVPVFGLADYANAASSRIVNGRDLEPAVHAEARAQLEQRLEDLLDAGLYPVGIVSGSLCTGKLGVVLQASKSMNLVPVVHYSTAGSSTLALALTLGEWFIHHPNVLVKSAAQRILSALRAHQWARAMNRSLELVALSVKLGLRTALIATHAHFLDRMSLSLVKEITARSATTQVTASILPEFADGLSMSFAPSGSTILEALHAAGGAWCTFLTHYPLYDSLSIDRLAAKVDSRRRQWDQKSPGKSGPLGAGNSQSERSGLESPSSNSGQLPAIAADQTYESVVIVEIDVVDIEEVKAARRRIVQAPILRESTAKVMWELGDGHLPLALMTGAYMSKLYFKARQESQKTGQPMKELSRMTKEGEAGFLQPGIDGLRDASWTELAPSSLNRLTVVFDVLPPRFQLLLKVVAGMTMQRQLWCPVALISKVVENLVSSRVAVTAEADVVTLTDLKILRADHRGVRFFNPALRDYVTELLTKRQRILINQLCAGLYASTLDGSASGQSKSGADDPVRRLVLARFTFFGYGLTEAYYQHLKAGWKKVLKMPFGTERSRIETQYANEFRLQKVDPMEVIGVQPRRILDCDPAKVGEKLPDLIVDVKNYTADICLGPLGGLLGLLGTLVSRRYFETTTRQSLTSPAELEYISSLFQGYEESLVIFEKALLLRQVSDVELVEPLSVDTVSQIETRAREETAKLRKMTVDYEVSDEATAMANATAFFQFTSTVMKERTEKWKQVMEGHCRSFIQKLRKGFYKMDGEPDDKYKLRLALIIFQENCACVNDGQPQGVADDTHGLNSLNLSLGKRSTIMLTKTVQGRRTRPLVVSAASTAL